MSDTPTFLAERIRSEGDKAIAFFSNLNPEQWQTAVYTEGETWTVRSVLAHYVTSEKAFLTIFCDIRDGGHGVSDNFEIDRYNASQQKKTKDLSPQDLLQQFISTRATMVDLVGSLSEQELAKQGRHPYLGQTALSEMIKMVYRHNQLHYRDIRKIL
jgi:hypothetical protein